MTESPSRPGSLRWFDPGWVTGATKATLVTPLLGRGEKTHWKSLEVSWLEGGAGRDHSPLPVVGKTGLTWGN